jgi:hypothetical protein
VARRVKWSRGGVFVIGVFLASVIGSVVAFLLGAGKVGNWMAAPSVILSGWAALGHLVTLDDDAPGGWSNQKRSRSFFYKSLGQLALKFVVFAGLLCLLAWLQPKGGQ